LNKISLNFKKRLYNCLENDDRSLIERENLINLLCLFYTMSDPPDRYGLFSKYRDYKNLFFEACESDHGDLIEDTFLNLYCHLHVHDAPYTKEERRRLDETLGYWCHSGGISPIIKAGSYLSKDSISADYGAGNGLQGLLIQKLFPHRKTIQIEISSKMVEVGKDLQKWLEIEPERVDWIVGDIHDYSPQNIDFIYLYRPVKPEGKGIAFYENFASELNSTNKKVIIFSIADCLKPFLSSNFYSFYNDGHLTCYVRNIYN